MKRTLRPNEDMPLIYLNREPVDFRLGFRGLSALVEQELEHNPFDGGLYAFTNHRRNKIKCLYSAIAPALLYLLHPCSRGKRMALCCITKAWLRKSSTGRSTVMSFYR